MSNRQLQTDCKRVKRVTDYIDEHLDSDLSLAQLSRRAHLSQFHFHRLFRYLVGIPVFEYIQLKRLTRASYALVFFPERAITAIAQDAGYANSESFSRAFKKAFRQTPTEFRSDPFSQPWMEKTQVLHLGGEFSMQVNIVHFPNTKIALLVHQGPEQEEMKSVAKFIAWRRANGYSPKNSETYGIFLGDPNSRPEQHRFGIGGAIEKDVDDNEFGVVNAEIPGGRCACVRQIGSPNNVEPGVRYLYRDWLPSSGEQLRDYPCFVHRVNLASRPPDKDAITDIYLPLR